MSANVHTFCTITTASHMAYTLALFDSLDQGHPYHLYVFVTDLDNLKQDSKDLPGNLTLLSEASFTGSETFQSIKKKYSKKPDNYRWSLKPVIMNYVLENTDTDSVIYLDNDLYFFNDHAFLFEALKTHRILLNPHWRIKSPAQSEPWFLVNFKDGVYNAGFAGASKEGIEILQWWAECCLWKCEQTPRKGLWDDQKYLDLIPAAFDGVQIIQHRGCNVAFWNQEENKRELVNGKVLINSKWPIVFIHFTKDLIKDIESGKDGNLKEYLETYRNSVQKYQ